MFGKTSLKIVCAVALMGSSSFASMFFLEDSAEPEVKAHDLPGLSAGALLGGNYYLGGVEAELQAFASYRIAAGHSIGIFAGLNFPQSLYEFGGEYHWYFSGQPIYENDDFLLLALSAATFEKFDDYVWAPRVTVGYGRDYRPFEKSDFAIRFSIGGSYLVGEMLTRENSEFSAQGAHTVLFIRLGIMR